MHFDLDILNDYYERGLLRRQEILFKVGLKYCYYDDPENSEVSKEINQYLDELREKYLTTDKPFN
jgi:hypothetical protein